MEHTILFTRQGEPETITLIKLCTPDAVSASIAFDRFHCGMNRWLTTTERGKELEAETTGDFNIGDLLTCDVTIPGDDDFKRILSAESVTFAACDGADHRVSYDRILCNPPPPLELSLTPNLTTRMFTTGLRF